MAPKPKKRPAAAKRQRPAAAKRPAAPVLPKQDSGVPAHKRRQFNDLIKEKGAPEPVLAYIENLKNSGYGVGKMKKMNRMIKDWMDMGFKHPTFTDIISMEEAKTRTDKQEAMPWSIMKAQVFHNSEAAALEALEENDIEAVQNPKDPDGKPWYTKTSQTIEHTTSLRRQHGMQVSGTVEGDVGGFLTTMESFFETLEGTFDLSQANPHIKPGQRSLANPAPENKDDDPMTQVFNKVKVACNNLNKLRIKVLEAVSDSKGAKHDAFVSSQRADKAPILQDTLAKYDELIKTKALPGARTQTTPTMIKQALAIDSKLCQQIASAIQVAKSMEE